MKVARLLGTGHFMECQTIAEIKPRVGGTTPVSKDIFVTGHEKYFTDNSNHYALGCIEDDKIISWIAIAFIENKTRGRFWVITSMYTTRFTEYFSFNNQEIGLLIKSAFELAEKKQYYEYYYSVGQRISKVYERQIQKNQYIPVGRYDYVELATVPANTKPEVDLYWKLMGQESKPDDIVIKKRILRQQFR